MTRESDEDRIRRKAHELWVAEGHPHGRDQDHWDQAREIIAIEDSQTSTLLPRDTGAETPVENADQALRNLADFPNLTDQGENLLTSTDREPDYATAGSAKSGEMPSVEVPTSDQPGIPERPMKTTTAPAPSKPVQAAQKKATAKSSAPEPSKSGAVPKKSVFTSKKK